MTITTFIVLAVCVAIFAILARLTIAALRAIPHVGGWIMYYAFLGVMLFLIGAVVAGGLGWI